MGKWKQRLADLDDAVVVSGTPMKTPKKITSAGVTDQSDDDAFNGYTVVRAENMVAALDIAKACPHLLIGTLEVAEKADMKI